MRKLLGFIFFIFLTFSNTVHAVRVPIENHQDRLLSNHELSKINFTDFLLFYDRESLQFAVNIEEVVRDVTSFYQTYSTGHCQDLDLQIFLLPRHVLNNRDTMGFLRWSDWNNQNIRGVYTSFHRPERGEIYINYEKSSNEFYLTLAHELFHFLTDKECKRLHYTESQAVRFSEMFCISSEYC